MIWLGVTVSGVLVFKIFSLTCSDSNCFEICVSLFLVLFFSGVDNAARLQLKREHIRSLLMVAKVSLELNLGCMHQQTQESAKMHTVPVLASTSRFLVLHFYKTPAFI